MIYPQKCGAGRTILLASILDGRGGSGRTDKFDVFDAIEKISG